MPACGFAPSQRERKTNVFKALPASSTIGAGCAVLVLCLKRFDARYNIF